LLKAVPTIDVADDLRNLFDCCLVVGASNQALAKSATPAGDQARMDTFVQPQTSSATTADAFSAVSWGSVAAGGVIIAAVSLPLLALGAGLGLSTVSPWSEAGISAATFKVTAGIYLVVVSVMSSAIGGYLAARLRTKWIGVHTNEAFFRDTAHGFIAWGFATLLSAGLLGAATSHLLGGTGAAIGSAVAQVNPNQVYVDRLFRNDAAPGAPPASGGNATADSSSAHADILRLWTSSYSTGSGLSSSDKDYVVRQVASQTGMSQPDAEKRVDETVQQAKVAADQVRRAAAQFAFWMTAAFLFGAFSASLAAVEGGQLRDGTWNDRKLVPRAW
jgi:hypothetical protein